MFGSAFLFSACSDDDEACTETEWYEDTDEDGLGDPDVSVFACDQPDGYVANADDTDDEDAVADEDVEYLITSDMFTAAPFNDMEVVTATLEDGTQALCYSITFSSDGIDGDEGPFCPETIDEVGGLAMYDGESNDYVPTLSVINRTLLETITADGYDIVDEDGNVNINTAGDDISTCLALEYDPDLQYTYLIPVEPKLADEVDEISEVEFIGVSIDGVPLTGNPPSAINGPAMFGGDGNAEQISFPSLDPCGGHPDPAGYYHLHFIPEVMNQVLDAKGITEVSCTLIDQTSSVQLSGFAKDGFPVYAYAEMPTDLDECNGRTGVTDEYPDGVYHYVASTTDAPNMPPCLKGVAARNSFEYN